MNRKVNRVELLKMLTAIALSLLIVFVIIFFVSDDPMGAISSFLLGPLKSIRRMGNIVELMIPLMFSGLAIIFLFRTGLFNLSGEGAIFSGAVVATIVILSLDVAPVLRMILAVLAAGLAGSFVTFIPGFLKVKFNANEIVTSLMLNFVCLNVGLYFIHGYFLDPQVNSPYSYKFDPGVGLPKLISGTRVHLGLIIALVVIGMAWLMLHRSAFGFRSKLVGANRKMAEYVGIGSTSIILLTQLLGGFVAGMGGSVELLGMYNRFQFGGLTGYGWDGIPIAIIARHNPKNLPFAALFISYLKIGADIMARESNVPFEIVQIIQAVMIIFISAQALLSGYKKKVMMQEVSKMEKEAANLE
ncbi:ABC transporter permease [Proteiniclasticum sp. BAD-10]|uniref:ABC transporter permease n=1 Tax=Proteiniclasticum sediminis TaxID=2804028 RepID=A0A941HPG8_9CLOT|nr:ABC transporter permease [Proteiniclasticum sediminis]MBR0575035.1 ABC transporter permease [Proteiniclasticum sediminis]